MCLIAVAIHQNEEFPLILISNRDEFYNRATQNMHWWKDKDILAGRDLKAGGTWLALNSKGQFATVTNYRDPQRNNPVAPSRGAIPVDILDADVKDFKAYVESQSDFWNQMNGFNLLFHDGENTFYYSNISHEITQLDTGIHTLSNAFLDTPWPKTKRIQSELDLLIRNQSMDEKSFLQLLGNSEKYPNKDLPDTGVGAIMEKMLSPICITSPIYGTRTHTIILKNKNGHIRITEKPISEKGIQHFEIPLLKR